MTELPISIERRGKRKTRGLVMAYGFVAIQHMYPFNAI